MSEHDRRYDLGIIGGGIIGAAAAAYAAEAGLRVVLFERDRIAAAASGRNSGAVQSPFDPVFAALHSRSIELYRETAVTDAGFALTPRPTGLMLLSLDEDAVRATHASISADRPDLRPEFLAAGEAARIEPALQRELAACRLETGYPVAPATATNAFALRAEAAGATLVLGKQATVDVSGKSATGIRTSGSAVTCDRVLVAAGPWTSDLIPGWSDSRPIGPVWGVVATTAIADAPRHILEELGIGHEAEMSGRLFSLVTVGDAVSVGSTFLEEKPDEASLATEILERGARFVPALASADLQSIRSCARPATRDGRPLIGLAPGYENLYVCAGHGPWGISTGPASAELIVSQVMGKSQESMLLSPSRVDAGLPANTEFA
jgi:glycine/D-amino acid oxidase-like deaminating enzyme